MGKFVNANGVTFNVDDSKDERYEADPSFESADKKKAPTKKAASSKSGN